MILSAKMGLVNYIKGPGAMHLHHIENLTHISPSQHACLQMCLAASAGTALGLQNIGKKE